MYGPVPYASFSRDEPLQIGDRVQLLVDDYIVEDAGLYAFQISD